MSFEEKIIYIKKYFGSKYSVIPPIKKEIIDEFEKKNNLKLPEFYRYFVSNVALGIVSIDKNNPLVDDILLPYNFETIHEDDDTLENPKKEFPLTKPIYKLYETDYNYDDLTNGTIFLKGTGCGNGERLIINGKASGQVWIDELISNDEMFPAYKQEMHDDHFKTWINKSFNSQIKVKRKKKVNADAVDYATNVTIVIILLCIITIALLFSNLE